MLHNVILSNIAKNVELTSEEQEHFTSLLKYEVIPKKGFLQRQDELCQKINFVNTGILRAYHINEKGKEITVMFAATDWWITDMNGFLNSQKSMVNIVALEESSILQLSHDQLEELYLQIPKFERFFRILMQKAYVREQLRTLENLSLSAEERYVILLNKYPKITKRISQKQLASYLGITPEFISQIRNSRTIS